MNALIDWHRAHHPLMEPQDVVKLIFQAMLGCGHLLGDEEAVTNRINAECSTLSPCKDEPLTEPLGQRFTRLNLRRAMAEGIPSQWIARMMIASPQSGLLRTDVVSALNALQDPAIDKIAQRLVDEPTWLPSHTSAYHAAYAPAYRVISSQFTVLLPALCAIAQQGPQKRLLVCIDGPCGSGKSTTAAHLQTILDAAVVPMDDFFLPHSQKTAQRLAQPGGNADWERVASQIVMPWLEQRPISYQPYDCHQDAMSTVVHVPDRRITIIEGSYSLMPAIRKHADVNLFMHITPEMQQKRIRNRDGEHALAMFLERWIPLEQAYFTAYCLPDAQCIVLDQPSQLV